MTVARFLQVTALLVLLAGCSRVQFAYNQLDWLIPDYLETYVEFSDEQRVMLNAKVDTLLTWHCSSQLSLYAGMLRSANTDLQAGAMTDERLGEYAMQLEGFWRAIMRRASPGVAELLLTVSDEQVEGLFMVFKEKNEEWRTEFEDQTDEERREKYRERMTEELERWFGPLSAMQQRAVLEWSRRLTPLGLEGLRSRQRWQATLREVIDNRADEGTFYAGIEELFVDPRALRSPATQKRFDDGRKLGLDLIHEIATHMDDAQRKHLANQTASVARDLDELVCAPEPPGGRKQKDKRASTPPRNDVRSDP